MINLETIFKHLEYGEFSDAPITGMNAIKKIPVEQNERVASYVYMALTALHTRFPLRHNEVVVQEKEAVSTYYLRPEYAISNEDSIYPYEDRYIMDSIDTPFLDNILKIEKAYDELGREVPLNDLSDLNTITTPNFDTVQLPEGVIGNAYYLVYRANHPEFNVDDWSTVDLSKINIEVPDHLQLAILLYCAERYYGGQNASDPAQISVNYMQRYEMECQRLQAFGIMQSDNLSNTKLEKNGWL